jgi:hypothetical protein
MLNAVWWAEDRAMKGLTVVLLLILISTLLYMTVGFIKAGPALFQLRREAPQITSESIAFWQLLDTWQPLDRAATRARHGHGRGNDGVSTARAVEWFRKILTGRHGQRHGRDGSTAL